MVETLKEDLEEVKKLKEENKKLREQAEKLLDNNQHLSELVKEMDKKIEAAPIKEAREKRKMIYDYEKHGMISKGELEREKLDIKKDKVTLADLNKQLQEILAMMKEEE